MSSCLQVPEMQYLRAISKMRICLWDELLPYHEVKEVLAVLSGRLDADLAKQLNVRATRPLRYYIKFVEYTLVPVALWLLGPAPRYPQAPLRSAAASNGGGLPRPGTDAAGVRLTRPRMYHPVSSRPVSSFLSSHPVSSHLIPFLVALFSRWSTVTSASAMTQARVKKIRVVFRRGARCLYSTRTRAGRRAIARRRRSGRPLPISLRSCSRYTAVLWLLLFCWMGPFVSLDRRSSRPTNRPTNQ